MAKKCVVRADSLMLQTTREYQILVGFNNNGSWPYTWYLYPQLRVRQAAVYACLKPGVSKRLRGTDNEGLYMPNHLPSCGNKATSTLLISVHLCLRQGFYYG